MIVPLRQGQSDGLQNVSKRLFQSRHNKSIYKTQLGST